MEGLISKIKSGKLKEQLKEKLIELVSSHQETFNHFAEIRKFTKEAYSGQGLTEYDVEFEGCDYCDDYIGKDLDEMQTLSYEYYNQYILPEIEEIKDDFESYLDDIGLEELIEIELNTSTISYSIYLIVFNNLNIDSFIEENNLNIEESKLTKLVEQNVKFDVRLSDHEDRHYPTNYERIDINYSDNLFSNGGKIHKSYGHLKNKNIQKCLLCSSLNIHNIVQKWIS